MEGENYKNLIQITNHCSANGVKLCIGRLFSLNEFDDDDDDADIRYTSDRDVSISFDLFNLLWTCFENKSFI